MIDFRFIAITCLTIFMLGGLPAAQAQANVEANVQVAADAESVVAEEKIAEAEIEVEAEEEDPCAVYKSEQAKIICFDRLQKIERMRAVKAKRQDALAAERERSNRDSRFQRNMTPKLKKDDAAEAALETVEAKEPKESEQDVEAEAEAEAETGSEADPEGKTKALETR
jgi:hypothetical protein